MPASHEIQPEAASGSPRLPGLDFIRGIAILLVLCRHLHLARPDETASWFHRAFFVLQRGGWCGVDLFFVLSGFLVSGLLFRQYQELGELRLGEFLVRRGFKIYPAFWIMLEVTILYNLLAGGTVLVLPLCVELCFVQNYLKGIYSHTWSLAVEEHCYLGLALLLWWLVKRRPRWTDPFRFIPIFACMGCILACGMRLRLTPRLEDLGPPSILFPTHLRFDGFLAGTALAYLACYQRSLFQRLIKLGIAGWICLGGLLLAPVFYFDVRRDPIVVNCFLTTNIAAALAWILAAHAGKKRELERSTFEHSGFIQYMGRTVCHGMKFVGKSSYSIYLWHELLEHMLIRPLVTFCFKSQLVPAEIWVPTYLTLSIGIGILLSLLIERPALKLRDRWWPTSHS